MIRVLRERKGISQAKLSELIGKSASSVGQYERGEIYPNYEALAKLVLVFNVSSDIFFTKEDSPNAMEELLVLNLFSQMNEIELENNDKFIQNLAQLLKLLKNNRIRNSESEEIT